MVRELSNHKITQKVSGQQEVSLRFLGCLMCDSLSKEARSLDLTFYSPLMQLAGRPRVSIQYLSTSGRSLSKVSY